MTKTAALATTLPPSPSNREPTAIVRWRPRVVTGSKVRVDVTNVCRRRRGSDDPREREVTRIWRGRRRGVALAGRSRELETLHLARRLFGEMEATGFPEQALVARPDAIDLTSAEQVIELGIDDIEFIQEPEADVTPLREPARIAWPTLLAGVLLGAVIATAVALLL